MEGSPPRQVFFREGEEGTVSSLAFTTHPQQPQQDTGKCGASWALAAAEMAESRLALDGEDVPPEDLSAQELLDCVDPDMGCGGGRVEAALTYMSNNGVGVEGEGNAWLEGQETGVCKLDPEDDRWYLGVIAQVSPCNQRELLRALVYLGPVAVHVKSSCRVRAYDGWGCWMDGWCSWHTQHV